MGRALISDVTWLLGLPIRASASNLRNDMSGPDMRNVPLFLVGGSVATISNYSHKSIRESLASHPPYLTNSDDFSVEREPDLCCSVGKDMSGRVGDLEGHDASVHCICHPGAKERK